MRLIDADALFREFEVTAWYNNADRDEVEELLLDAPTIEARPVVKGEWLGEAREAFTEECSICGCTVYWEDGRPHRYNFCPNCGAEMRGEDNEAD